MTLEEHLRRQKETGVRDIVPPKSVDINSVCLWKR